MMTCRPFDSEIERFHLLLDWGLLDKKELESIEESAAYRDADIEQILRYDYLIPRRRLLEALGEYYQCAWVEYDERIPVPPELLAGLNPEKLCMQGWFPVAREGERVIIAASDPRDELLMSEVKESLHVEHCEFRVALREEILFFIQDFLNADPEHLIGNERTGLAFWRNTMARWRTRLACYRTDFASARTHLSFLRGGLGLITIGRTLLLIRKQSPFLALYWMMIMVGGLFVLFGLFSYFKIKKSILSPPKHETLVEVTAATLYFLENYQFVEQRPADSFLKSTMLCRLADLLPNSCVYIEASLDNKVRSYLAHERTSLAAQRTVFACFRTIYARARTGLSFIRTGISFAGIGLGLIGYFGLSLFTILDSTVIAAGIAMAVDGMVWYWPVRKEHGEATKCGFIP
ncbi:GspE/PulE/PilB domain-containing protein [Desulforhabdus amnigena]|uniref:Type II secretion system protein GspE N-terminal domain-containing protein n=1 Tax=Desulforhabdus amnigena TaxID=40218 RepID=A0A9W6CYF2_9BACT|nr:hypothetical protein [Desulforhabdus amnigena]GLI34111.1 hypothetical protein DAMNIGENAA_15440 [Desulforhabdus amnigena]